MPTYKVTVEFSGTKTYEIYAENPDEIEKLFEKLSSFDRIDNPIDDRVSEVILNIVEVETK